MAEANTDVDIDNVSALYQISTFYTQVHRTAAVAGPGSSIYTFEKFKEGRELLSSVAAWNNSGRSSIHPDSERYLWPVEGSDELAYFRNGFDRLIRGLRDELRDSVFSGEYEAWNELFQRCPNVLEVAVTAYNMHDPGYTKEKAAVAMQYHVRVGEISSLHGDEVTVNIDGDQGVHDYPFEEVWIRIGRRRGSPSLTLSVWGTRLRGHWHNSDFTDRNLFCNDSSTTSEIKRFKKVESLEKETITNEIRMAWIAVFKKQHILQQWTRHSRVSSSDATETAAGTAEGDEPAVEVSKVRMLDYRVIRLPRALAGNIQAEDGEIPGRSTLLANFGFKELVMTYSFRDCSDHMQHVAVVKLQYLAPGCDVEDMDGYEEYEVHLTPEDTSKSVNLQIAIQQQAGPHMSCRAMMPEEYAEVFSKLYTDHRLSGNNQNFKLVTQFGMQCDVTSELDTQELLFVTENYVINARKGYKDGGVRTLQEAGYVFEAGLFLKHTNSGMSTTGFPRLRGIDYDRRYNGDTNACKGRRRLVLKEYLEMMVAFFGPVNGPAVLCTQGMVWAGMLYSEWQEMDGCFPVSFLLSTAANYGKTTACRGFQASQGMLPKLSGSCSTVSGFLSTLNATGGITFIMDDFATELTNKNTTNNWKETLKSVHDANSVTQHQKTRTPRSAALLTSNMTLQGHDEPLQTRLFTVEFHKPPEDLAYLASRFKDSYRNIGSLIPDILSIRWEGVLDKQYIDELEAFLMVYVMALSIPSRIALHLKKPMYYVLLLSQVLRPTANPMNSGNTEQDSLSDSEYAIAYMQHWLDHNLFGYLIDVQMRHYHAFVPQLDMWQKFLKIVSLTWQGCDRNSRISLHHHNMAFVDRNFDGGSVVVNNPVSFCCLVVTDVLRICRHYYPEACAHFTTQHLLSVQPQWLLDSYYQTGSIGFWGGGLPITRTVSEGDESSRETHVRLMSWDEVVQIPDMHVRKDCIFFPKSLLNVDATAHQPGFDDLVTNWRDVTIERDMQTVNLYNELTDGSWPGYRALDLFTDYDGDDDDDDGGDDDDEDDDEDDDNNDPQSKRPRINPVASSVMQQIHEVARQDEDFDNRRAHALLDALAADGGDETEEEDEEEEDEDDAEVSPHNYMDLQAIEE